MDRGFFINHLIECDCFPDEDFISDECQLWVNAINGEHCTVPYDEILVDSTWCHIVYELNVRPPLDFDDTFHVYQSFRDTSLNL